MGMRYFSTRVQKNFEKNFRLGQGIILQIKDGVKGSISFKP